MLKRIFIIGLFLNLLPLSLVSQKLLLSGKVEDNTGFPVALANVAIQTCSDSCVIARTVTDDNGSFSFDLDALPVPVTLHVSAIGFEDAFVDTQNADAGVIVLKPAAYMLNEVFVKASKHIVSLKNNGIRVSVSGTYLSYTGTTLELLGKIPFVFKSGTNIEVIGKGVPIIYINNRQVRDLHELEQLSSSSVKNIEVITSPGARYSSTANAVIRITTLAPMGEGFSFSGRTTLGLKHYAYLFEQLNFNYRAKGLDLFGALNYENYRECPRFENVVTQYLRAGLVEQHSIGQEMAKYPVYAGKLGLNYNDRVHSFGLLYDFKFNPSKTNGQSETSRYGTYISEEVLGNFFVANRHNRQHLLSAYYSATLEKWKLTANIDALWQINDRFTEENERSSVNPLRNFNTMNKVGNRLLAGNLMATCAVWFGDLRFGMETNGIHRTDRYAGNADYIASNDNRIDETTTALFVESDQKFGVVSAGVGLRWEYTDSKFYLFGRYSPEQSRTYHNFAPSLFVAFPMGTVKANFAYTRKTSRPVFSQLSSAVKYIDRYTYETGNPNLRPIFRDNFSFSSSWKDLMVQLEYTSTKNYFMWQTFPYPSNTEATLQTIQNMPRFHTYSAFINYAPSFFGCWHPVLMAAVVVQDFKLVHHGTELKLNRPLGVFRFNNAVQLPYEVWLNVDFLLHTDGDAENNRNHNYWNCDIGLYKSFLNDTWNVKLQLGDVFGTWRQKFVMYDALTRSSVVKRYHTRDLNLTIRYNFNATRSRYKGHGAGNDEKGRL